MTLDDAWFRQFFLDHYDHLCRYAFRWGLERAEAEETVQDVFVRVWHAPQALEAATSPSAYLHGAVRNALLNRLRKARTVRRLHDRARAEHRSPGVSVDAGHAPDILTERAALAQAVQLAIDSLPGRGREALLLQRESGLSYAEIAGVMGISESTVKTHIARALAALRETLTPWRDGAAMAPGSGSSPKDVSAGIGARGSDEHRPSPPDLHRHVRPASQRS